VENQAPFDVERRGTIFERPCERFGRFVEIAATPVVLKVARPLAAGVSPTDQVVGSDNEQSPVIDLLDRRYSSTPDCSELRGTLARGGADVAQGLTALALRQRKH
jgi:hypothetical protein